MTRTEALKQIVREAQLERLTKVGHKRILTAAKALTLDAEETVALERALEYRREDGSLVLVDQRNRFTR